MTNGTSSSSNTSGRELGPDYEIRYPQMPKEADPKYARWKVALKKEFGRLDDGTILVGHSIGGTILINTLVEEPPDLALSGIFLLAAPFVGEGGWPSEDIKPMSDLGKRLPAQTPVYAYHGSEDEDGAVRACRPLREGYSASCRTPAHRS